MPTNCIEYNLINNIPIIYPNISPLKFNLCPRYTIADADKILHCFDKNTEDVFINDSKFKFIKIPINAFINDDIEALHYYVIIDNKINYNVDIHSHQDIYEWIERANDYHYVVVTTPVLRFNVTLYNIANDSNISVIIHSENEVLDDKLMITKLIDNNCFTICDDFNITTSLYHKNFLDKSNFLNITSFLQTTKYMYYTTSKWFQIINHHRILNACDLPTMLLFTKPHLIDNDIYDLYENTLFDDDYIFLQSEYKKNIIFTSMISSSYPNTNVRMMNVIFGTNWYENIWTNKRCLHKYYPEYNDCIFINDIMGLFASFVNVDDMWDYWCENKEQFIFYLKASLNGKKQILIQYLFAIFRLYNIGYEGITVKKSRLRSIWKDILLYFNNNDFIVDIFDTLVLINNNINVAISAPYLFLSDAHQICNIDYISNKLRFVSKYNDFIYKNSNLYSIIANNNTINNIFYFHKNILQKRMIVVLLTIYKKFNMFSNSITTNQTEYAIGTILIEYLSQNKQFLF